MTTTTIEAVVEIDLDHLAPHPRNVRRSLGDLKDLTRSIRDRGIETPLIVLPADGNGVHHIVAGHRRRAAAETAGLLTLPCLVRDFNDEADVLLSMIAENTQRSEGLNIVDEAQALAAVIDLRGGTVSARKLAAAVGHSEGWVRTRLALLCLPDSALDALRAAKLTLDVAAALTVAADHPELIDQLVTQRGLSVWHVEAAQRKLLADLAVTEAAVRIEATGVAAIGEDEWRANQASWKTLDDLGLDPKSHRSESCHTVVVKARYDGTVVEIPACIEPRRHRGRKPDSELVVAASRPSEADQTATADRRERRLATQSRIDWVGERLRTGRPPAIAGASPLAMATWIDSAPYAVTQRAVTLLGIDRPDDGYVKLLQEHLAADPKQLATIALALVAATAEECARQSPASTVVVRYLDAIERLGYQPTDWEQAKRLTNDAA
ncbi:MAG: Chromosome partitioning protein ParB [Ilumatobacteraceae bacterium]|nr:Chromosome partitioning protein ParB [Ilumatobacteraceae bacterium]